MELTINLHNKFIYLPLSYYKFPDSIKRSIDTNASKFIWKKYIQTPYKCITNFKLYFRYFNYFEII